MRTLQFYERIIFGFILDLRLNSLKVTSKIDPIVAPLFKNFTFPFAKI